MGIFDELAESYTYNGAVSIKAIEDDIVILENQLDYLEEAKKELQLRGRKIAPIVEKIRDTKIRLSLLKALYKRVNDKSVPDDVILSVLGISANNANEIEQPKTAAEDKEPILQDFEESEIEVTEEAVDDTDVVENENEDDEDVIVDENDNVAETTSDDLAYEDADEDLQTVGVSKIEPEIEANIVQAEAIGSESDKKIYRLGHEIDINDEAGDVIIEQNSTPSHTDCFIPIEEEVDNITYPGESEDNMAKSISIDKAVKLLTDKQEECDYECPPPPGWDDYFEPVEWFDTEVNNQEYDNEVSSVQCQKEDEIDDSKNVVTYEDNSEMNEVSVELSDPQDIAYDFPAYDAFPNEPISEIYSSFDLSQYTDMINTDTVVGAFDNKRKILEVTFHDIRDYSIFIKLMKQKRPGLFSFLEKPKSIFMDVHERHGDEEKIYHYEFTNCKLKGLLDSRYSPKSETVTTETVSHECTAVFKYKKLKLT